MRGGHLGQAQHGVGHTAPSPQMRRPRHRLEVAVWAAAGVGEHWALCQCSLGSSPPAPASRQGLTPTRMLWRKRSQGLSPPWRCQDPRSPLHGVTKRFSLWDSAPPAAPPYEGAEADPRLKPAKPRGVWTHNEVIRGSRGSPLPPPGRSGHQEGSAEPAVSTPSAQRVGADVPPAALGSTVLNRGAFDLCPKTGAKPRVLVKSATLISNGRTAGRS